MSIYSSSFVILLLYHTELLTFHWCPATCCMHTVVLTLLYSTGQQQTGYVSSGDASTEPVCHLDIIRVVLTRIYSLCFVLFSQESIREFQYGFAILLLFCVKLETLLKTLWENVCVSLAKCLCLIYRWSACYLSNFSVGQYSYAYFASCSSALGIQDPRTCSIKCA